jgi:Ras family protein T1
MVSVKNHDILEGVGKTSIIITIVSETFPRQVSKTYHPVILSSDLYMLPINTSTVLLDSSSAREDEAAIDAEVDKAHVIILVYDVNNVECIRRLKSHWLPRIAKANDKVRLFSFCLSLIDTCHPGGEQSGSAV